MDDQKKERRAGIQSLNVSLDIIEHLTDTGEAGITELAATSDVTKSTVHSHLTTLEDRGYVIKEGSTYKPGVKFLKLGRGIQRHERLYEAAKDDIDELIDDIGERAQVMIREGNQGAHIYRAAGDRAVKTDSDIGTHVAMHATAAGKSYLSCLEDEEIELIIEATGLPQYTDETITTEEELFEVIEETRERGFALNMEENIEGLRAIGAPITDDVSGDVLGAISVSGPTTRFAGEYLNETLPTKVMQVAKVVSIKATYHDI